MIVYQVVDDLNRPMYESADFDDASQEAEILNLIYEERFFFVEEAIKVLH